jgi:hypothetical protein
MLDIRVRIQLLDFLIGQSVRGAIVKRVALIERSRAGRLDHHGTLAVGQLDGFPPIAADRVVVGVAPVEAGCCFRRAGLCVIDILEQKEAVIWCHVRSPNSCAGWCSCLPLASR